MYELDKINDVSVLRLYGEVSLLEMELIQNLLDSLKAHQHSKILINLAHVDYVHLKAVKQWAAQAEELKRSNGGLKLAGAKEETKHMLKFTGADQYLKDYASEGEAILSFLKRPLARDSVATAEGSLNSAKAGTSLETWDDGEMH